MKTSFVSTQAVSNATRLSLLKLQNDLAKATKEMSSGRHADVGLELGNRTGQTVQVRQELTRLETILDTNGLVAARLKTTQTALDSVQQTAQDMLGALVGLRNTADAASTLAPQAALNLNGLVNSLNANLNGQYLFAGINTDVEPVSAYAGPAPSPQADVEAAFAAAFGGLTPDDPGVAAITPAAMQAFLDGPFAALFDPAGWGTWSAASDQNVRSRITTTELVETSVNANEAPFRQLGMAYTMLSKLGGANLSEGAYKAVIETATRALGSALQGVTVAQSRLGVAQGRVAAADERLGVQRNILNQQILAFEHVDPYETASRINALEVQLETSYSLTARIRELSLLDYIR